MTPLSTFKSLLFLCNLSQFHSLFYNLLLTLRKALTFSSLYNYSSSIITSHQEALLTLLHPIGYCQIHLLNTTLNMSLPIQKTFSGSSIPTRGAFKVLQNLASNLPLCSPMIPINEAFCSSPIWFIHSPPKPLYHPNLQHTLHQGSQTC